MPRKPTIHARNARAVLIERAKSLPPETSLPPLAVMGEEFDLHPATIFRILRDLAAEGVYWQSPGGRFFQASERKARSKGVPLCFIGRELWKWSRLYQELLEGLSEVCAANESPLVLLSSRTLVRQESPVEPPRFASAAVQSAELAKILPLIPKGCAGVVLDHMWCESALGVCSWPGGERVQLLCGSEKVAIVFAPAWEKAVSAVRTVLQELPGARIALVKPFLGDRAIDLLYNKLQSALNDFSLESIVFHAGAKWAQFDVVVCPEDNIAMEIARLLPPKSATRIVGAQGTSVLQAPHIRLRVDYRRLGRSAGAYLLHGTNPSPSRISLVRPETY